MTANNPEEHATVRNTDLVQEHELKVWPLFYGALESGKKTFEVRNDRDRGFEVGDTLRLREYEPTGGGTYSGRECKRTVTYVLSGDECPGFGVEPGYVVLGLAHEAAAEIERLLAIEQRAKHVREGVALGCNVRDASEVSPYSAFDRATSGGSL